MSPEKFKAAMARGLAASPFVESLTYKRGDASITLTGCPVSLSTNALEVAQEGVMPEHVLHTQILKTKLTFRPDQELDRLSYNGRTYKFKLTAGDVAASAAWVLEGRSPLK
jgi:hypothetical protein